jgi:hypothetical protein
MTITNVTANQIAPDRSGSVRAREAAEAASNYTVNDRKHRPGTSARAAAEK